VVDSRPSDAIALAVRLDVPIFVEETVMERASITPDEEVESETSETGEKSEGTGRLSIFEDFVESLDLDDLDSEEDEE
jgi:bifunctional DNase/RNase